ncbi:MAG TPA: peptide ABC transporter substrate-binding protein [Firmicutes bacterium]|jgi:ABC-type oligopeptide transport system substrate-binding subunit|nr:peptide ABC transporter substrate-binding protein [Bacillota bacterium]
MKTNGRKLLLATILLFMVTAIAPLQLNMAEASKSIAINLAANPLSFDPLFAMIDAEKILLANCHEGLVLWDQGVLAPGMAERWYISADAKTYTFHLKEAYWSNGDQLTAEDFELSWKRILSTELGTAPGELLAVIKNARAYGEGKLASGEEVGVKALDKRVLQVVLEEPCSYFLNLLTFPAFMPVHAKYLQEKNLNYAPGFCSNGPFRIGEMEAGNHAILLANEYYRGARGNIREIRVTFLQPKTGVTLFGAGMLDLLEDPPFSMFGEYTDRLVQASTMGTGFLYLNTRRPPLNNVLFRKALSLALNRDLLVAKTLGYAGVPATGLIPPGMADSKSGSDFRQTGGDLIGPADGKKSLDLLYQAGYPNEDGYPPLEILVVDSLVPNEMAKTIAEMWEVNLGLKTEVKAVSYNDFLALAASNRFYTARQGWTGDYPDPMTFLQLFQSQAPENFACYQNMEYDYWLAVARKTTDSISRFKIYHQLEERLLSDLPVIPLYFSVKPYLVSPKLTGLTYTPQGYPLFQKARKMD